jgi:hypothetical protein
VKNDSVLIPKEKWLEANCLQNEPQIACFDKLWKVHEQQTRILLRMQQVIIDGPPVVMKEFTPEERMRLDKAIELLEACSEDLFITGENKALETQVDSFLAMHRKDNGHYIGLDRLPSSLKE